MDWCTEDAYTLQFVVIHTLWCSPCSLQPSLCLPVLPSHVPPLSLCFPSALLQVILLKTCLFLDVFVFADLMPKAHEWRSARIFSMSTDPKTQQRGHLGSFEISVFPSGAHSGRSRQQITFFSCSIKSQHSDISIHIISSTSSETFKAIKTFQRLNHAKYFCKQSCYHVAMNSCSKPPSFY